MEPIAPNELFDWKDYKSWKEKLETIYSAFLTPAFIKKIKRNRNMIECKNDFSLFCALSGFPEEYLLTNNHQRLFRKQFPLLRVYHSCRPVDIEMYYKNGLLITDTMSLFKTFRDIFQERFSYLNPSHFQDILNAEIENPRTGDNAKLHLGLDDRRLIFSCGHYLIYGSETIHGWAMKLPGGCYDKYRETLRSIGKPTMFCLNLPNTHKYLPDYYLEELLQRVLSLWMYNTANNLADANNLSFTIAIKESLPPHFIHSHYFPDQIPGQHYYPKIYDCKSGKHT